MNANIINTITRLAEACQADIFSDAPECADAVTDVFVLAEAVLREIAERPTNRLVLFLASADADEGTQAAVFLDERGAHDWIIEQLDEGASRADFEMHLAENPDEHDIFSYIDLHRRDGLDTFNLDEQTITIPRPVIVAGLEGGIVQGASATCPVDLIVVDYDTEGADLEDIIQTPQSDGGFVEALIGEPGVVVDPAWVEQVLAAYMAHDPDLADDDDGFLVVDGHDDAGNLAGDGQIAPFYVFSPAKQDNVAGPFDSREEAAQAMEAMLSAPDDLEDAVAAAEASFAPADAVCGQCEGTGTITGGLTGDGDDEPCPVCDATGSLVETSEVKTAFAITETPDGQVPWVMTDAKVEPAIEPDGFVTIGGYQPLETPLVFSISAERQSLMALHAESIALERASQHIYPEASRDVCQRLAALSGNIVSLMQQSAIDRERGA